MLFNNIGLVWSKGLIHLLRLVYKISRTNELIQAAGWGLGSNPHGGNLVFKPLSGSFQLQTLHCGATLICASSGELIIYYHFSFFFFFGSSEYTYSGLPLIRPCQIWAKQGHICSKLLLSVELDKYHKKEKSYNWEFY